jgi:hypothetical protein
MEKGRRIQIKSQKIQAQPRNLGNNSPPSKNPDGPNKKTKHVTG